MDHHSQSPFTNAPPEFLEQQRKILESMLGSKIGATEQFPQGKITDDDEGELRFSVTTHKGQVIIDFGKPIVWAGFNPDQAMQLADALKRRAREAERQSASI